MDSLLSSDSIMYRVNTTAVCNQLEEEFESEKQMTKAALRKLVSSNIRQLNVFFRDTEWKMDGETELQICEKTVANPEQSGGYIKVYCLNSRLFSDTEIRILHLFYSGNESLSELAHHMEERLDMKGLKLQQVGTEIDVKQKLHQLGAEMEFPSAFGFVPWRHHVEIVTKCKTIEEALFYVRKTIEESWSRSVLIDNIKAHLYQSSGNALTNFAEKLPTIQGKLAQEIVKDTYDFGFVSLPAGYDEKELEDALEQNITRFLLELGSGFAFIGRQKEIIVAGKTRKIDMLFYHIKLRCYVVVELKAVSFEPEFAGKLNFYVNAVNQLMKTDDDNPTIGLLICKDKDQTEVQWAFQEIETPMGVATYDNIRMNEIKSQLSSEEAIQKRLEQAEEEYLLKLQEKNK